MKFNNINMKEEKEKRKEKTFGGITIFPNAEKVLKSNFSSTSCERFPINKFAPTSSAFLDWADCKKD